MWVSLIYLICFGLGTTLVLWGAVPAQAKNPELPPLAQLRDANKNNRIERNEAAGPLAPSFDEIDCDKSNGLDGDEIRGFFAGEECKPPKIKSTATASETPELNTGELLFNLYLPRTSTMFTKVIKPWTEEIFQVTGGRIKIKFTASTLAPINRQLRMVSTGVADAGMGIHHFTRRRTVTARVSELPFSARSSRAATIAAWRTVQKFAKPSEYKGVRLMGVISPPPTLIFNSKKAVKLIKEFRSLKILAAGSLVSPAKLMGSPVVTIPLPLAYEPFSRGVVDGTFSNYGGIMEYKLAKFVNFATPVPGGVGNTSIFFVINQKKLDSLEQSERRAIFNVSGEEFGKYANAWDEFENNAKLAAKDAGITVSPLSKSAMKELRKRWSVLEPQWISDAKKLEIDGQAAVVFYRSELNKLEKTN